jgi:hypothetical protein
MRGPAWTSEEDEILIEMAEEGKTLMEIFRSGRIKKCYSSISKRKGKLGFNKDLRRGYSTYSNEDTWQIWILNQKGYSRKRIAEMLGKPKGGISYQMTKYALVYHPPRIPCPEHLQPIVEELGGLAK